MVSISYKFGEIEKYLVSLLQELVSILYNLVSLLLKMGIFLIRFIYYFSNINN